MAHLLNREYIGGGNSDSRARFPHTASLDQAHLDGVDQLVARENVGDDHDLIAFRQQPVLAEEALGPQDRRLRVVAEFNHKWRDAPQQIELVANSVAVRECKDRRNLWSQ